jgi:bifunctional aspartokinase / homoserine dehydrogenase 1
MSAPLKNRDTSLSSTEPLARRAVGSLVSHQHRSVHGQLRGNAKKPLRVMKFGGTSVADASSIEKVADIVHAAARESNVVVVVSAMSGVTNKLVEAATQSEAGNHHVAVTIFEELRKRHESAASALIRSVEQRQLISCRMQELLQEANGLCHDAVLRRELTLRSRDSIVGLGERLSAPLVAAALLARGVTSEAIEATELVITDACHGSAQPCMDLTRERSEARLRPLLLRGIVPVVTGFIGATLDGALTTLGRNSSDYSGTIMGAALDADEVTLWTDVDGILTADPRLVPSARPILEMSYREASDLAESGAKVLHPKTLQPVMERCIPLSIRNTFAPDRPGTKITATGPCSNSEVKALAVTSDLAMISVRGAGGAEVHDVFSRTLKAAEAAKADVRLIPQSHCSPSAVCLVVSSVFAQATVEALRHEFAQELTHKQLGSIDLELPVAIIAVVGESTLGIQALMGRVLRALEAENLNVLASAQGSSQSSFSLVVRQQGMKATLLTTHQELCLNGVTSLELPNRIL